MIGQLEIDYFKVYEEQALRSNNDLNSKILNTTHMIIGMITEIEEIRACFKGFDSTFLGVTELPIQKKTVLTSYMLNSEDVTKRFYNFKEEIGDFFWYLNGLCHYRDLSFSFCLEKSFDIINWKTVSNKSTKDDLNTHILNLYDSCTEILDAVKKELVYNKPIDHSDLLSNMFKIINNLIELIINALYYFSNSSKNLTFSFYEVLFNNLEKLKVRYPDKFASENAINRDLEAENKILYKES